MSPISTTDWISERTSDFTVDTVRQIRFVWKPLVFIASLLPFALVVGDLFEITGRLGANPVEEIQDRFGN